MQPAQKEEASGTVRAQWIGAGVLLFLVLCMFADVLFTGHPRILSDGQTDLASQFIYWRSFAADQLRHGRVPLWNPHVFSGTPFLGWAQAGALYPPNWLDVFLPLPLSINLGIALHVFLAGLFTYLWGLRRGLAPIAAMVSGALFMFSGAYFLHVFAGHLSLLCAVAWTPLIFSCLDGWIGTQKWGWILLGSVAVAMQMLAGDMQACFYTALAAGLFLAFDLIRSKGQTKIILGLLVMYFAAAALGAVQLLTSFQAASESVRADGISYQFASMVSFAPENLLTLLAPGFFGDMTSVPYWGRWYLWEMCLFIGVSGLSLAIYGAIHGDRSTRGTLIPLTLILLILSLGSNTPLFPVLYRWIPGFNRFRANAKFIVEATLFLALFAGNGLDRLLKSPRSHKRWAVGSVLSAMVVCGGAIMIQTAATQTDGWWAHRLQAISSTKETYLPPAKYADGTFTQNAGSFASRRLFIAAVEFLIIAALFFLSGKSNRAVYALAFMAVAEIFVFARNTRATFDPSITESPRLKAFLDRHPGDYRILYPRNDNIAMALGGYDVWGYAPLALKRYAEFMAFTQGQSPEEATQYLDFTRLHPLHGLLRLRYAFVPDTNGDHIVAAKSVMPHLQLFQDYRVVQGRDEILQEMASPTFHHQQQVILETEPHPAPIASTETGTATLVDSSAGHLTIEADLPHPAILLITDAYSSGWHAHSLEAGAQTAYQVLPADYTIQAVPLSAGHHHFQLEYLPAAYENGKRISLGSLIVFLLVTGHHMRKNRLSRRFETD